MAQWKSEIFEWYKVEAEVEAAYRLQRVSF